MIKDDAPSDRFIWLDGSFLVGPLTGVAYYTLNLMAALAQEPFGRHIRVSDGWSSLALAEALAMHRMASTRRDGSSGASWAARSLLRKNESLRAMARSVRSSLWTRRWRRREGIFHALNSAPPMRLSMPIVPTIHDLSCLVHPQTHSVERVRHFERHIPLFERAPVIHTVSHFSAGEIMRVLGLAQERIRVISPGPDPEALAFPLEAPNEADRSWLDQFKLAPEAYCLAVGTLEPRKNLPLLIKAFLALPHPVQDRFPLILAGTSGWGRIEWPAGTERARSDGRIKPLGYLPRPDLLRLIRFARVSAYPSIYEGFGLPVLESLSMGTPCLVTAGTACEEAGGGDAVALNGADPAAWTAALAEAAATARPLAIRHEGRARIAARPSWSDAARETLGLYRAAGWHDGA